MKRVERYARYRAPAESGRKLVAPPWSELGSLVAEGREWRALATVELCGRPLAELTEAGRQELIAESLRYVGSYCPERFAVADASAPLILTGHQPGLVHPGVWLKNFAAAALAGASRGNSAHLIIDGDVCRTAAALVPGGDVGEPRLTPVEFDSPAAALPWEERRILDQNVWRSFPERVHEAAPLVRDPFVDDWWPSVLERGHADGTLGGSLAQARHLAEIAWGRRNLELPQGRLCQTTTFRWFVCSVLQDLPRFVAVHNEALGEYRRRHKLRNHAHPAPNLASDGPWLEAPLWIWSTADPRRRPAFVRRDAGGVTVSDRHGWEGRLPLEPGQRLEGALAELAAWEARGVKVRSRALVTTMFARLVLADLFIHGIGGAKYDEATDAICQGFFGVTPPPFAAMSGTLHLPIDHPPGSQDAVRKLRHELREAEFHPERRLRLDSLQLSDRRVAEAAVASKQAAINSAGGAASAAERHAAIVTANRTIASFIAGERQRIEAGLGTTIVRSRANRVLESREYAFCLYPQRNLEQFLLDFGS